MHAPFDLGDIVRRWQFCRLYGEDLPEIAVCALEAGFDTPALREYLRSRPLWL